METNNKVTWQPPIDFDDEVSETQHLMASNNKNVVFKVVFKTWLELSVSSLTLKINRKCKQLTF